MQDKIQYLVQQDNIKDVIPEREVLQQRPGQSCDISGDTLITPQSSSLLPGVVQHSLVYIHPDVGLNFSTVGQWDHVVP